MAERKKRKRSDSTSSSPMSEQPISSCSEPSVSDPPAAPSGVSMKSDSSMYQPLGFKKTQSESTAPSLISMKSDHSMYQPLGFKDTQREPPTAPSLISLKSDHSMYQPLGFKETQSESAAPSVVSMKSDSSMYQPLGFKSQKTQSRPTGESSSCPVQHTEEDIGHSHLLDAKKSLKEAMQKKFTLTSEGNGDQGSSLNKIYTELIITTGESEGPHDEHAFRSIKHKLKRHSSKQSIINLSDIAKPLSGQETPHRTVLTKGVAGIGKSFAVQKFVLDWAEYRENQDVDFIFCLAFREVNLSRDDKSLHELLTELHPALRSLINSEDYNRARVTVILDGLDESRFQLDFANKMVTSVSEVTSVGNLLTNLIQGNLLPNAKVWITSRPTAASQIPAEFVHMVTEIRGFSDPQKEEYFKRRFSLDLGLADRIVSHIRSSQSLDIMCQIPIFCWISALLFEEIFRGNENDEIPQTITEMMAHFLFAQTKRSSRKYDKITETNKERLLKKHRDFLLKLGKLAFVQLQKNNLIFYEEDLEDSGIDKAEATIYSGFCNAALREEHVVSQKKVFFFVHLTVGESGVR